MKRINVLLMLVLAAAIGLFGAYHLWIHNNLDTTGPDIRIEEGILKLSVEDGEEALLRGITAVDARDGDVTASILVESVTGISREGLTTVVYAAFDRAGNVSKAERQICYSDYISPRFQLDGALIFAHGVNFDVLDYVGAVDVLEGDIRRRVHATLISNTKSVNEMGSHVVRFQVTNSLGDTVELDLPVEVCDPQWFNASVVLSEYLIYVERGASVDPADYLEAFNIRGEEIDVSGQTPDDVSCDITGQVNTRVPGVYEITYVLSKNVGLQTFTGQSKLIVVVME